MLNTNTVFKNTQKAHYLEMMKGGPPFESCKEQKVLKVISDKEKLMYFRMGIPFMSDRDNLIRFTQEEQPDSSTIL